MPTPAEILNRYRELKNSIPDIIEISMQQTAGELAHEQREQLYRGERRDGKPITPEYSSRTVAIKKRKGQPTDRVTWKDTGALYANLVIDVRQDVYIIDSNVPYIPKLYTKYGEEVLGLNSKSREAYIEKLQPVLLQNIKEEIGKR